MVDDEDILMAPNSFVELQQEIQLLQKSGPASEPELTAILPVSPPIRRKASNEGVGRYVTLSVLNSDTNTIVGYKNDIGSSEHPELSVAPPVAGPSNPPHASFGTKKKTISTGSDRKLGQEGYLVYKGRGRYAHVYVRFLSALIR